MSVPSGTDIVFLLYYVYKKKLSAIQISIMSSRQQSLRVIYKKLRKILELGDWQPPAVCDNICVGTFINFENR